MRSHSGRRIVGCDGGLGLLAGLGIRVTNNKTAIEIFVEFTGPPPHLVVGAFRVWRRAVALARTRLAHFFRLLVLGEHGTTQQPRACILPKAGWAVKRKRFATAEVEGRGRWLLRREFLDGFCAQAIMFKRSVSFRNARRAWFPACKVCVPGDWPGRV